MIGIFKGNVYKNINFIENALDSYCSALRLYEKSVQLKDDIHNIADLGSFLCPTVGKCYFEISKLLFDRGRVLDALIYELEAIRYLLALSYEHSDKKGAANPELNDVYKSLYKAKDSLGKIRQVSREYVRRDMIMSIFVSSEKVKDMYEYANNYLIGTGTPFVPILVTEDTPFVAPERLKLFTKIISDELRPVISLTIADILARIGFVLYTIRETIQIERCPGISGKKGEC
jgi:tetratricopeptide (TPR) repeat protein